MIQNKLAKCCTGLYCLLCLQRSIAVNFPKMATKVVEDFCANNVEGARISGIVRSVTCTKGLLFGHKNEENFMRAVPWPNFGRLTV